MPLDQAVEDVTLQEAKQHVIHAEEDSAKEKEVYSEKLAVAAKVEIQYEKGQSPIVSMAKQRDEKRTEREDNKRQSLEH